MATKEDAKEMIQDMFVMMDRLESNRHRQLLPHAVINQSLLSCVRVLQPLTQRMLSDESNPQPILYVHAIHRCVREVLAVFDGLLHEACNFFGTHEPLVFKQDIALLVDCLQMHSAHLVGWLADPSVQPSAEPLARNLFVQLFWQKHFPGKKQCAWSEFNNAFAVQYGPQTSFAMDQLQSALNRCCDALALTVAKGRLDVRQLDHLCVGHRTLFAAYQAVADPSTAVVMAGKLLPNQPLTPTVLRPLLGLSIAMLACGDMHACALTSTGLLFTWGTGNSGRLGHGDIMDKREPTLLRHSTTVPFKQMACGFAFTGAVSVEGKLYTWGAHSNGRLGLNVQENQLIPRKVSALDGLTVASFHAGSVNSTVVTNQGHVYTFGLSLYSGQNSREDITDPRRLEEFVAEPVQQVSMAADGFHTIALTKSGKVYTWGHNRVGQLGLPAAVVAALPLSPGNEAEKAHYSPKPVLVPGLPDDIKMVSAGWGHSCVLTMEGHVYVCGRGLEGQLGLPATSLQVNAQGKRYQPTFKRVEHPLLDFKRVRSVHCGGNCTIMQGGEVEVLGMGAAMHGQMPCDMSRAITGVPFQIPRPDILPYFQQEQKQVLQVATGVTSSLFLLGKRVDVLTLAKLCSDTIRGNPRLISMLHADRESTGEVLSDNDVYLNRVRSSME